MSTSIFRWWAQKRSKALSWTVGCLSGTSLLEQVRQRGEQDRKHMTTRHERASKLREFWWGLAQRAWMEPTRTLYIPSLYFAAWLLRFVSWGRYSLRATVPTSKKKMWSKSLGRSLEFVKCSEKARGKIGNRIRLAIIIALRSVLAVSCQWTDGAADADNFLFYSTFVEYDGPFAEESKVKTRDNKDLQWPGQLPQAQQASHNQTDEVP